MRLLREIRAQRAIQRTARGVAGGDRELMEVMLADLRRAVATLERKLAES